MIEKEQPIEPALSQLMNDIGTILHRALQDATVNLGMKYGFALLMFGLEGDDKGRMNYISDCNRQDMLVAMKEFIARNEGTYENFTQKRKM